MNLKTKILLTLIILFAAVTLLGVLGSYHLDKLAKDSVMMMRENNNSLSHTREMSIAISEMVSILSLKNYEKKSQRVNFKQAAGKFERHLNLQTNNITEENEGDVTTEIEKNFQDFKEQMLDSLAVDGNYSFEIYMHQVYINDLLNQIYDLNKEAINTKQKEADDIADNVILFMIIVGFFFFGFALFSLFYFPSYIADPIKGLTESIKQIAQKNYDQRLEVKSGDEFGEMASSFNLMAQKLQEYESVNVNQILSEKQRIETIISQMNDAIIGIDDQENILFINPIAEKLMDVIEEEMVGKNAANLAETHPIFKKMVAEVLKGNIKQDSYTSTLTLDKAGKKLYFNKDVLVVQTSDKLNQKNQEPEFAESGNHQSNNDLVGYVIILKNITELKEMDLAKTNFMATLSHELKTPISAISMSVSLMEDSRIGDLNEEQIELAETIKHNTARLLKMVNEILDISKIETGNVQINTEIAEPQMIISRAVNNVKAFIVEKNIEIKKSFAKDLSAMPMDILKTTGVLTNFLTNAIRYSEYGKPIEIDVTRNNGSVEFLVTDFGKGIIKDDQKEVFQRYRRGKNDKTKGTGLGLAISKEFIEAQGGKIWVESKVGKGSKFGFALPVTPD